VSPLQREKREPRTAPPEYGTQRVAIWLADERHGMADCDARRANAQQEHQKMLVQADDEHSAWEPPFRVLFGMVLSLGIVALASAVGDSIHALRVVRERLLGIQAGTIAAVFRRASAAPVTAPAACPTGCPLPLRRPRSRCEAFGVLAAGADAPVICLQVAAFVHLVLIILGLLGMI
jgi:hypothetical protein